MSIPYIQTTLAQVRAQSGTYVSYPFIEDGDTVTKVYNMPCTQLESDYNASQLELDDPMTNATTAGVIDLPFPGDSNAYFVGDTGHTPSEGGMLSFNRRFANLPKSLLVPSGSTFVTFPGIGPGSLGIESMGNVIGTGAGLTFETKLNHGLIVGDVVEIQSVYATGDDGNGHTKNLGSVNSPVTEKVIVTNVISNDEIQVDFGDYPYVYTWTVYGGTIARTSFPELPVINSISMTYGTPGIVLQFASDHLISAGLDVDITLSYKIGNDPFIHAVSGRYLVETVTSSSSFLIDVGHFFNSQVSLTLVSGKAKIMDFRRTAQSINVVTETRYDYILPGVSAGVSDSLELEVPKNFTVRDASGSLTNSVEEFRWEEYAGTYRGYFPTTPNRHDYVQMVHDGHHIIIEASLKEWAGNILVMKTKTCKAQ